MTGPARVVLDTNCVLSALLFTNGTLAPVRHAWQRGVLCPLVSSATTTELIRALNYSKLKLSKEDQEELLGDYLPFCVAVTIPTKVPRIPECRDPADVPFLQLAMVGKAARLVTGDRDLLDLEGRCSIPIISPAEFLRMLSGT